MQTMPYNFNTEPLLRFLQEWFATNVNSLPAIAWSLDDLKWKPSLWFQQREEGCWRQVVAIVGKWGNCEMLHLWCRETDVRGSWQPIRLHIRPIRNSCRYLEYPFHDTRTIEVSAT
jgi:hypothetical protein